MPASAASPSPPWPYPVDTGRPITGTSTSPATTVGSAPSLPAATTRTSSSRSRLDAVADSRRGRIVGPGLAGHENRLWDAAALLAGRVEPPGVHRHVPREPRLGRLG
jgi:hypothetical protein